MTRQQTLAALGENPEVSVLIIGGGINGIGSFRDLALQGVDVLLVERDDFCSGASAASSHMAHGGLRYLENGEFRLVREALTERNRMRQNAPHYVKPLPTTIPIFHWFSGMLNAPLKFAGLLDKPSNRGALVIKIGLTVYDWFTRGQQTLPTHQFHSRAESLRRRPALNKDIVATATYYDAWMPYPERIALELVLDAERDAQVQQPNARALNYVSAVDADATHVTLHDELTGDTVQVKPQIVVNAAGPWIDFTNEALGRGSRFIGGTKGSHLVVDHPQLHDLLQGQEIFFENEDGRICLFFPLLDKVLVGTTDIRIDNPDEARCTDEEIDYLLGMIHIVFPNMQLDRSHIVFWFSGVRPLPASEAGATGQISRDHSIKVIEAGARAEYPILSLVGGKWTTYRAFSEQVTNDVLKRLGRQRKTRTVNTPIGGGINYPEDRQRWLADQQTATGLDRERLETLFERYGTKSLAIVDYCQQGDDQPLQSLPTYTRRELMFLVENEKVMRLDDVLLRRTLIAMLGFANGAVVAEVAEICAAVLGWKAARKKEEIQRTVTLLTEKHGMATERFVAVASM